MWEKMGKTHTATLSYPASVFMALWIVLVFTEGMNPGMPIENLAVEPWFPQLLCMKLKKQVVELVHVSGTTKLPKQGHLIQS